MNALLSLWLPILLSAVTVFVISSLIHMLLNWHASDYGHFSNEDAVRDAIRAGNPAPGRYMFPRCGEMKDMATEAMKEKFSKGPVGHVTILPNGVPNMGKYLGQWFLLCVVVSIVVACLVAKIYSRDPAFAMAVAKFTFAVSFIAYGFGTLQESIWSGRPWGQSVKYLVDSTLYAAGTGAVFYWLW